MRLSRQIEYRERGRSQMRALANRAMRETVTQDEYLAEREAIIAALPELPRTIRQRVREYGDAYMRAMTDHHVVCMYCVQGKLYRLSNEHRPELQQFPSWESLPRELWPGMPSGLYWVNNGSPVRFF